MPAGEELGLIQSWRLKSSVRPCHPSSKPLPLDDGLCLSQIAPRMHRHGLMCHEGGLTLVSTATCQGGKRWQQSKQCVQGGRVHCRRAPASQSCRSDKLQAEVCLQHRGHGLALLGCGWAGEDHRARFRQQRALKGDRKPLPKGVTRGWLSVSFRCSGAVPILFA